MSVPIEVYVQEGPDKYMVYNAETDDNMDYDDVGFSYESSAKEWAERQGFVVVDKP